MTTPDQIEEGLVRAAAIALLGERATPAQRRQSATVLAWLRLIPDARHRRVTAMRIIPCASSGQQPAWQDIAAELRISRDTAVAWHHAALQHIANAKEHTEMSNWSKPTETTITVGGMTPAAHDAQQAGAAGRPLITVTDPDDGVTRKVAPGRQIEVAGRRYTAGSLVRLPIETAAGLMQQGVLVHVDWEPPPPYQPGRVTQHGADGQGRS